MAQDITKVYRLPGQLSIGGTALGFTAHGSASLTLFAGYGKELLYVEERGITPIGVVAKGFSCRAILELAQWDASTLARCFPGMVSGTTVSVSPDTLVAGTRMDQTTGYRFSFSWVSEQASPSQITVAADRCVATISADAIRFGLDIENSLPLECDIIWDGAGTLFSITIA